jgi:putative tryptophan/tyrosine transport system substrate-binding protein
MIPRRDFITLLGAGAVAWPLAARAQQPGTPVIGVLHQGAPEANKEFIASFLQGLRQSGYVEGQNVKIEFRWAEARYDRLPGLAADLAHQNVAVMAAAYLPAALAAKSATRTIPIVFVSGSDPIETGLVANFNRPSGNVTGIVITAMLGAKRLELLRQLVPQADHIAVMANPTNRNTQAHIKDIQAAALTLAQKIQIFDVSSDSELETTFATLAQQRADALLVNPDTFLQDRRDQIIAWAAHHRVPAMYYQREFVTAGGLMSYGTPDKDGFRLAGIYAARLLRGEKPADLPVMQPTKFELIINLVTAKSLGLDIPPTLLALADEVIE